MLTTKEVFTNFHIAEGSNIFFLGLFTRYYGVQRDIPIFRFGHVAMCPDDLNWVG